VQTFYVTTPIYYVNARPHLGHAYTTILADSVNRMHRMLRDQSFFLTGTDEHGDKIVQAAEEQGQHPQEYVDAISREFRELWPRLGVEPDGFVRTTEAEHVRCVQRFLQTVYDNGDIYFGEYGGHYCFGCECFYTEKELEDGLCPDHRKEPTYIRETNYFFRMSKYQDWLREYIQEHPEFIQPEQYRREILAMLRQDLDDLCISRPKSRLTWGIELPFDSDYVTYVWFDALINYVSALGWPDGELFAMYWPRAHHLVAKDIIKPHAIFWPTMLKAAGIEPYQGLRVHGYWTVDEAKMSKSLGNVVEPLAMRDKYGLDAFRYFLLREMQFGHDGSFSEEALVNRFNADLANDLGNLFNRSLSMLHKYCSGRVPEAHDPAEEDLVLMESGIKGLAAFVEDFADFRVSRGLASLWEFVRDLNKYIDATAPWSLNKQGQTERLATVMATVAGGLRKVALALWPVMPRASERMLEQLGLQPDPATEDFQREIKEWHPVPPGTEVAKKSNLFPRQEVRVQEAAGAEAATASARGASSESELAQPVDFSDFQKLDLRIGRVLAAERVPKADKLLRLEVDVGEADKRQIVAGLAESFEPEGLVGRQVVVVANLKPRKIRGQTSQGMVLAVHDQAGLQLVEPAGDVQPGSKVS